MKDKPTSFILARPTITNPLGAMISQILAAILIAAVVVLLTWVYQRFHGQVPATPHPTLVSPATSLQTSRPGPPVPKPTSDQETSFEETQDEAGPKVSEHHEDIARSAATLKTDDNIQQQSDSQKPKATPHPTPVSPTTSIQASQTGSPDPNIVQEALSEETQDEAGPYVSEDTTRSAATLKTDEDQQQQADSQTPKAISPTNASLEMDAVRLQPRGRVVVVAESDPNQHLHSARGELQEEESLPLAASGDFALPPVRRENSQASQLLGPRNQDSTRSATETAPKHYLGQNPSQQEDETAPKHYLGQNLSQQEDETTPKHYLRHYPNLQVEETTPKQYLSQGPSQHMIELKDPANIGEEVSRTDSSAMPPDVDPSELQVIHEQRQSTYQETTVNSNVTAARDELLQGASLAVSAGPALSTIPRESSPACQAQLYGNQGSISPDTEPTSRQHLGPGNEGRVSLPPQRSRLRLQEPPSNWRFDNLLADLNNMITTDELDTLKDKFQSCLRKKATGEIKSPRDLFRQLKQREFLYANDIIYLQAILMKLGRQDLLERTTDYCLQAGNVLHLQPATGTPENGCKYVRVHLCLDKDYSRDDLTRLHCRVADILCCPSEFVHLPVVEPPQSLLVTILLPEMYANILIKYLDQNHLHDRFATIQVYEIEVCHKPGDEQLFSLYHQLSKRDLQIEGMDNTCDQLQQKIQQLEAQEEAKTAQLAESDEKRKQLMAKVEMLENKVESKAALIEESEQKYKQLEQKVEQLEQQKIQQLEEQEEAQTAQLAESEEKHKQLLAKVEMLENKMESTATLIKESEQTCKQLWQKIEQFEQGNRKLQDSKEVLLQDIDILNKENISLNNKIQETDRQLQLYREMMETIYDCHDEYIDSLTNKLTQLESGIYEKSLQSGDSRYMQVPLATLAACWCHMVQELQTEVNHFNEEQDSNIPPGGKHLTCQMETLT